MNNKKDIIIGLRLQIKDLEAKKIALTAGLDRKIKSYQDAIDSLEIENDNITSFNGTDKSTNHITNFRDTIKNIVLNEITKFESANTIAHIAANYFPKKKFQVISGQVSGVLSAWKRNGDITKYQFSTSRVDTVWGRKEWLDETGHPKPKYFNNTGNLITSVSNLEMELRS